MSREDALAREDRRVADQRFLDEVARRRFLPFFVSACEVFRVSVDDVLSTANRHPDVVRARHVLVYLAWDKCRLSPGVIARLMRRDRSDTSKRVTQLRHRIAHDQAFAVDVARVLGKAVVNL